MALIFTEEQWLEMEHEISEFEEWQNRLNEDISYLMFEPATDENLQKLASVIDYHFSDIMFRHEDHEIKVERLSDGGIGITVMLDYEDRPDDYYVDFEIEPGVNYEIRMTAEHPFARNDDIDELPSIIDDVECEVRCWADIEAELEKWQEVMDMARIAAMSDATAAEGTAKPETQQKKTTESPDDILFAPIQLEQKKSEERTPDPYLDCCGCF